MARRRELEGEKEVDLAALVDIFANMLFFLLATVSLLQLKTLNAAVPALSTGAVSTGKAVDVSVQIKPSGFFLQASGDPADKDKKLEPVRVEIPRKGDGSLDTRALTEKLWQIKQIAPETKNIMLFPEQGIVFEEIVQTMDASREMPSIRDPNKKVQLFPRPVLSELVTDDDEAGVPRPPRGRR